MSFFFSPLYIDAWPSHSTLGKCPLFWAPERETLHINSYVVHTGMFEVLLTDNTRKNLRSSGQDVLSILGSRLRQRECFWGSRSDTSEVAPFGSVDNVETLENYLKTLDYTCFCFNCFVFSRLADSNVFCSVSYSLLCLSSAFFFSEALCDVCSREGECINKLWIIINWLLASSHFEKVAPRPKQVERPRRQDKKTLLSFHFYHSPPPILIQYESGVNLLNTLSSENSFFKINLWRK